MAEITQRNVTVGGARSLVRECGPAQAREAVVFIHGNPGAGEDWVDLLPRIGEFARAIAADMPGNGKVDRPEGVAAAHGAPAERGKGVRNARRRSAALASRAGTDGH